MTAPAQPLVSVVTPLYNGEAFLAECIESVLAQTYSSWEYVIANNCSTDRSLEIAQRYARQDSRIRIHNNAAFLIQFQNWNHTLRQIAPDSAYCKVLHADDWLFPECLARMVEIAEAHPSVGIVSAYRLDENRVNLDGLPYPSVVVPGRKIGRLALTSSLHVFGSPTSLLIRSDIVRNRTAFYDETVLHTDTDVCFDILRDHDFGFVHQVLTFTRRHNESLTSFTHRFNTRYLANFVFFLRYGPVFLDEHEFQQRLAQRVENYHRFLARSVLELKGREFWRFHRDELRKLGHPVQTLRLIKALLIVLLDFRQAVHNLRRALAARKQPTQPRDVPTLDTVLSTIYTRDS